MSATTISYYVEAPVGEDVSAVVAPWVATDPYQAGLDALHWEITLAAKKATYRGERMVRTASRCGVEFRSVG